MNKHCAICDAPSSLVKGTLEVLGVEVGEEYYRCTACGEEFLTFAQAQAAERIAQAKENTRGGRARARRTPASARTR
jgi:DNA-directed RNA polymerase subunit RPC12/RpoP